MDKAMEMRVNKAWEITRCESTENEDAKIAMNQPIITKIVYL